MTYGHAEIVYQHYASFISNVTSWVTFSQNEGILEMQARLLPSAAVAAGVGHAKLVIQEQNRQGTWTTVFEGSLCSAINRATGILGISELKMTSQDPMRFVSPVVDAGDRTNLSSMRKLRARFEFTGGTVADWRADWQLSVR